MPKVTKNWESEYLDAASILEDARAREIEERQNAEIMAEIELCRRMEEDEEFARREREELEAEIRAEEAFFDVDDDYYDEDYAYWRERS